MTAIKGYVVRGKDARGRAAFAVPDDENGYEPYHRGELFLTPDAEAACFARLELLAYACTDVAIFRVHNDGTEERLPSYEEALALLGGDPLAALEAAERRLLEADGWRQIEPDAYGGEQWQHPKHGRECRMVALTIARKAGVK